MTNKESLFYHLDCLSIEPKLLIFGKERYKTKLGAIIGLFSTTLILAMSAYFIYETLDKENLTIYMNLKRITNPLLNMTNMPMMIHLLDRNSIPIYNPNESYFEMKIQNLNVVPDENKSLNSTRLTFDFDKCNLKNHFGNHSSYFENIPYLTDYYCIPPSVNRSMWNTYGDTINGYGIWSIWLYACVNTTQNNNKCAPKKEISTALETVFWSLTFLDYDVDHTNYENPAVLYTRTERFQVGLSIYKRHIFTSKLVGYNTDYGFAFSDHRVREFHQFDKFSVDVDLRTGSQFSGGFSNISFRVNPLMDYYNRRYVKVQMMVANIGGVIKGILFMGSLFVNLFVKKLFYTDLYNHLSVKENNYKETGGNKSGLESKLVGLKSETNIMGMESRLTVLKSVPVLTVQSNIEYINLFIFRTSKFNSRLKNLQGKNKLTFTLKQLICPCRDKHDINVLIYNDWEKQMYKKQSLEYILQKLSEIDRLQEKNECRNNCKKNNYSVPQKIEENIIKRVEMSKAKLGNHSKLIINK